MNRSAEHAALTRIDAFLPSPAFLHGGKRSDPAERFAEQAFNRGTAELGVGTQLGEHPLYLALTKAELAQRGEDLGVRIDELRCDRSTVGGAIGMPEAEGALVVELDEQLAAMSGSMMR
jgi:hypothetical protein